MIRQVIQQRKYDNPYIENEVNTLGIITGAHQYHAPNKAPT